MLQAMMPPIVKKAIHFKLVMLSELTKSLEDSDECMRTSNYLENDELENPLEVLVTVLPHIALSVCNALQATQISTAVEVFHKQLRELALNSPVNASSMCRVRSIIDIAVDLDTKFNNAVELPICLGTPSVEENLQAQICIILTRKFAESMLRILSVRARDESTDVFCDVLQDAVRSMR